MGVSSSVSIPPVCEVIKEWDWDRVVLVIKAYSDQEYDFGIDHSIVTTITGLNAEDSKAFMSILSKSDTGMVNAITLLAAAICLGDSRNINLEARIETLFDIMDFSNNGQVSADEMALLFYCTATAISAIIQKSDTLPSVSAMARLSSCVSGDVGKDSHAAILKSEFVSWIVHLLSSLPDIKLDLVYQELFLTARTSMYKESVVDGDTMGGESSVTFDDNTVDSDS